jgi:hypothetical protein
MAVIFPDVEVTLVTYLNSALVGIGSTLANNVRVATKKAQPDETQPAKQIVVTAAYNGEVNYVTKIASVTLEVYATDYGTASNLGLLVESLIRGSTGDQIKRVTVRLGPVRQLEESDYEKRSIDAEIIVKGSDL